MKFYCGRFFKLHALSFGLFAFLGLRSNEMSLFTFDLLHEVPVALAHSIQRNCFLGDGDYNSHDFVPFGINDATVE